MSRETVASAHLSFSKNNYSVKEDVRVLIDAAGTTPHKHVQAISHVGEEVIEVGDVGSLYTVMLRNLDSTNYVKVRGHTAITDTIRLLPLGAPALFTVDSGAVLYAIADTATCEISVLAVPA